MAICTCGWVSTRVALARDRAGQLRKDQTKPEQEALNLHRVHK